MSKLHLDKRAGALIQDAPENYNDEDLLSTMQVAAWLGTSPQWVEQSRPKGIGPPFIRITPSMVRYKRGDVISWLKQREQNSLAEYDRTDGAKAAKAAREAVKAAAKRAGKTKTSRAGRSTRGAAAATG